MKAHVELDREPTDWVRVHKATGHRSFVTRSTALHRLYMAQGEITPQAAIELIESGEPFETEFARYYRGRK